MKPTQELVGKVRSFNRYYTNVIGLLDQHYLDSPFSLTEGRVLYEICHTENCSAKKIRESIAIDEGYLSRIIESFGKSGLIRKTPSREDRRLHLITLTEKGQREFSKLNDNSDKMISEMIGRLSDRERAELVGIMERMRELLDPGQPDHLP